MQAVSIAVLGQGTVAVACCRSLMHQRELDWTAHLLSTKMVPFLLKMPYVSRRWRALAARVTRAQAYQFCRWQVAHQSSS